ncbi:HEAT repeat domain-containing protein [Chloroflexota bacterium]
MGQLADRAVAPLLVELLDDEALEVQVAAANALGRLRDPATVRWLVGAVVDNPHDWTRRAAAHALSEFAVEELAGLVDAIQQAPVDGMPDDENRARILAALESIDSPAIRLKLQEDNGIFGTGEDKAETAKDREGNMMRQVLKNLEDINLLARRNRRRTSPDESESEAAVQAVADDLYQQEGLPPAVNSDGSGAQAHRRLKHLTTAQPDTPDAAAGALPDVAWNQRRKAILALGDERPDVAIPLLIKALYDDDQLVRVAAVQTLATFQVEEAMQGLYTALADEDYLVCDTAANAFGAVGKPAVPYLLRALESVNINMRGAAIEALGRIGDPDTISALEKYLSDEARPAVSDQRNCDLAAHALEIIGTPDALKRVLRWRADHTADSRIATSFEQASQAVLTDAPWPEDIPDDEKMRQLLDTLHHSDWHTRQQAAKQLRNYTRTLHYNTDPAIVRPLEMAALDPAWEVRWTAAEALGWVASTTSVPILIELLGDEHWVIRVAAVRALLEIHDVQAVPYLADALHDDKEQVREAAAEALGELGATSGAAIVSLQTALQDEAHFVQLAAIVALGKLQDQSSVDLLALRVQEPDVNIRWATVKALQRIGTPECVPALQIALQDTEGPFFEDERIHEVAAAALAHIDSPGDIDNLSVV